MFTNKMKDDELEDLILSWAVAYQALAIPYETFWDFKLSERKSYMDDLSEKLHEWFYDNLMCDHTDDLSEEKRDKLEEKWFNWADIIELIQTSDYFELLFRFIEQIADTDRQIGKIEVTRRKVIVKYE